MGPGRLRNAQCEWLTSKSMPAGISKFSSFSSHGFPKVMNSLRNTAAHAIQRGLEEALPADAGRKPQRLLLRKREQSSTSLLGSEAVGGASSAHALYAPCACAQLPAVMRTHYSLRSCLERRQQVWALGNRVYAGFCLVSEVLFKAAIIHAQSAMSKVRQVGVLSTHISELGGEAVKNIFCRFSPPHPTACSFEARYIVTKHAPLIPYLPTAHGTVLIVFLKYLFPEEAARKK